MRLAARSSGSSGGGPGGLRPADVERQLGGDAAAPAVAPPVVAPEVAGHGEQPGDRVVVGHVVEPPPGDGQGLGHEVVGVGAS